MPTIVEVVYGKNHHNYSNFEIKFLRTIEYSNESEIVVVVAEVLYKLKKIQSPMSRCDAPERVRESERLS